MAIAAIGSGQQHLGILYKTDLSDGVKLGHLAWHHDLRERDPKPNYLWIDPPIPAIRTFQVATRCRQILKANQKGVPYGFSPPNDCFDDQTGQFLLGTTGVGLGLGVFLMVLTPKTDCKIPQLCSYNVMRSGNQQKGVIIELGINFQWLSRTTINKQTP